MPEPHSISHRRVALRRASARRAFSSSIERVHAEDPAHSPTPAAPSGVSRRSARRKSCCAKKIMARIRATAPRGDPGGRAWSKAHARVRDPPRVREAGNAGDLRKDPPREKNPRRWLRRGRRLVQADPAAALEADSRPCWACAKPFNGARRPPTSMESTQKYAERVDHVRHGARGVNGGEISGRVLGEPRVRARSTRR